MPHIPVLLKESLQYLNAARGGRFIDGTAGDGGHTLGLLQANPHSEVLAVDWDEQAVTLLKEKLKSQNLENRCVVLKGNYADILKFIPEKFSLVNGIILDLGFSSRQIDDPMRGFSFQKSGPLDMRYNQQQTLSAFEVINRYPETKLAQILKNYGEEKFSKSIARKIAVLRKVSPIADTGQIIRVIKDALPKPHKYRFADSARRVFQAIRIEVNSELTNLKRFLPPAIELLRPGGRMVIMSFHSLEDRIVKQFFAGLAKVCVCPPDFPVCVCGQTPRFKILTRKPIRADLQEIKDNPRSHSAKLRAVEKI